MSKIIVFIASMSSFSGNTTSENEERLIGLTNIYAFLKVV